MSLRAAQAGFGSLVRRGRDAKSLAKPARRRLLRGVPGLAVEESAALTAIPTERLAVYHDLVLGGHKTMIRYALGTTLDALALIQKAKPDLARRESFVDTIEAFLADRRGPATHSIRELADVFAALLRRRFAAAFKAFPILRDLVLFESAELAVELETDGPGRHATEADFARLAEGTLDDLLRTRLRRPSYERRFAFKSDLVGIVRALRSESAKVRVSDLSRSGPCHMILVRDAVRLAPFRHDLDATAFRDLGRMPVGKAFRAEDLGLLRARRGPRGESEETAAGRTATELFSWLKGGLLLLA